MTDYVYDEGKYLQELTDYVNATYGEHYAQNKFQATEFIIDSGHGDGFCIGNIMKYAQRYGKKNGYNRADILKVIHYAIIQLYVHDHSNRDGEESVADGEATTMQLLNETGLDQIMAIHIANADAEIAKATTKYYNEVDGSDGAPSSTRTKLF